MAAQFSEIIGDSRRGLCSCSARATSSLPVPDSPRTSTVDSVGATRRIRSKSCRIGAQEPIIPAIGYSRLSSDFRTALCRARRSARPTRPIVRSSSSGSNGRARKSAAPSFMASTAALRLACSASTTTGTSPASAIRSVPNPPGRRRSVRIMAKDRRSSARAPSSESTAVTSKPFSVRRVPRGLAPMGFASAMSTWLMRQLAFIYTGRMVADCARVSGREDEVSVKESWVRSAPGCARPAELCGGRFVGVVRKL